MTYSNWRWIRSSENTNDNECLQAKSTVNRTWNVRVQNHLLITYSWYESLCLVSNGEYFVEQKMILFHPNKSWIQWKTERKLKFLSTTCGTHFILQCRVKCNPNCSDVFFILFCLHSIHFCFSSVPFYSRHFFKHLMSSDGICDLFSLYSFRLQKL